jgi:prevent-host-death family protein
MRTFSSANAKNHFGELVDAARIAPVAITKYDKPFVVMLAVEQYERLKLIEKELRLKSPVRDASSRSAPKD